MANGAVSSYKKTDIDKVYDAAVKAAKQAYTDTVSRNNAKAKAVKSSIKAENDKKRSDTYVNARLSAIGNNEALAGAGVAGGLYDAPRSGLSETSRIANDNTLRSNIAALNERESADKAAADLEALIANYDADRELQNETAALSADRAKEKAEDNRFAAQYDLDNFEAYLAAHELQNEIGLNLLSKTTANAAAAELKKYGKVKTAATAELLGVSVGTSAETVLSNIIKSSLL